MDEFSLIDRLLKPLAPGAGGVESPGLAAIGVNPLGLADDAALLTPPPGRELVVTTDMLHAEVHFFADDPPDCIAKKALRVNLSDLAAMGADPVCYFLSLGLPRDMTDGWLQAFAAALHEDQGCYGIRLAGGDTTVSKGPLCLSITAVGSVPSGTALRRSGAKIGDDLWVSGTLGDAALGLAVRHAVHAEGAWRQAVVERYLLPEPRLGLGVALRGIATAAMDLSDGLTQDLSHLCGASGVGAEVNLTSLPLSDAVRHAMKDAEADWPLIVSGGDDYELLFTAPRKCETKIAEIAAETGIAVARIGRIVKGSCVSWHDSEGAPVNLPSLGYLHRTI